MVPSAHPRVDAAVKSTLGNTLDCLEGAVNYRDWLFAEAAPHLGSSVLEIGAGVGTLTACLADRERVVALEIDADWAASMRLRFALNPNIEVVEGDITDTALMLSYAGDFELAMSFNVFEHIADDRAAMEAVFRALRPDGLFVCFVPAFPSIYVPWTGRSVITGATRGEA